MMPARRSVSIETRSGLMSSLIEIRGSNWRAPSSVAALAIRTAWPSTVEPSTPSISTLPLVLTIRPSPPRVSGYVLVHSSVACPLSGPMPTQPVSATTSGNASTANPRRGKLQRYVTRASGNTYAQRGVSVQLNRDQLRDPRLLHGHAVQTIGDLHRLPVVRDEDELSVLLHAAQHFYEPADVCVVEGRVDLIEEAERTRLVLEEPEHQRDRGERLLAARQQLDALEALARRLRDDFDAALERIVLVEEREAGAAAAEERAEGFLEVDVDRGERVGEATARRLVDALDRF